ncbi:MAG: hypothetical protein HS129_04955 [Leptospiraceae bacterium]|nr:hypothetical protein [Leptospiraceae bacterium]
MQPNFIPFIKSSAIVEVERNGDYLNTIMLVSTPKRDEQGDMVLSEAWLNKTDMDYSSKKAVIDWNHYSRLLPFQKSSSIQEKANNEKLGNEAIIGVPSGRKFFTESGNLYCESKWNVKNPYISPYVPLIKAGYEGLEASAGGGFYKPKPETVAKYGEKTYDRARITHVAICPAGEAINDETEIKMLKSSIANEFDIDYSDVPVTDSMIIPVNAIENISEKAEQRIFEFIINSLEYKLWATNKLLEKILPNQPLDYEFYYDHFRDYGFGRDYAKRLATQMIIEHGGESNG